MPDTKKILFFRLGAIGDVLLTTPAVKKAKELFPGAEIHYMTEAKAAPVLYNNPYIDKIIELKQAKHFLPRDFGIFFIAGFLRGMFSKEKYDYFFDFESSYYSVYISFFIKAARKIGFWINQKKRALYNRFYDRRVKYDAADRYMAERFLALVKEEVPFDAAETGPVLKVSGVEKERAGSFYNNYTGARNGKIILFGVSGTWATKKWPDRYWVELAKMITAGVKDSKIFILWGPSDPMELLDALAAIKGVYIIPAVGLRELIVIISGGNLLVANDGGPRHMAQALGLKTIGLFGPTNDKGWANPDKDNLVMAAAVDCRPCDKISCENDDCMSQITPELVFEKLKSLL